MIDPLARITQADGGDGRVGNQLEGAGRVGVLRAEQSCGAIGGKRQDDPIGALLETTGSL